MPFPDLSYFTLVFGNVCGVRDEVSECVILQSLRVLYLSYYVGTTSESDIGPRNGKC